MDRDGKFTPDFRAILKDSGTTPVRLPARSPNLNAHAERFVRSIKEECLSRMIIFGEAMLRHVVKSYVEHYHTERNHQGLVNRIIDPDDSVGRIEGEISAANISADCSSITTAAPLEADCGNAVS